VYIPIPFSNYISCYAYNPSQRYEYKKPLAKSGIYDTIYMAIVNKLEVFRRFFMIQASNITLRLGKRALFEEVNIKFTQGNCYGLIGANGAGKSTFLKILNGQLEPTKGDVVITPGERLSFLQQDHFKYDAFEVLETVIMGNKRLYEIMKEKDVIYAKEDFTEADGLRASELEGEFAAMDGWEAESNAASLLNGLGIETDLHTLKMSEVNGGEKVKVLLAQALFGNPDILLLDEPTNHLDLEAIRWLEEFLINFENTVIVVSHDRYFLNKVCTHIADIDYAKIQLYSGNYDFWYESSQLMVKQMKDANKKKEEKIKELQDFIQRFSANASKSKQATSRKKALDKIELDDIRPSSRKYPYIDFRPSREIGNEVLTVENLSKTIDGVKILDKISFMVGKEDKIAFVGPNTNASTVLFKILSGELEPDEGSYKWGITTNVSYFPKDNTKLFAGEETIVDFLMPFSPEKDVTYVRGFMGRMLFAGEEGSKKVKVLSGGERVRVLLSKMMIAGANVLILDEPTNHLDMESITSLNNGLIKFPGVALFTSPDHQFIQTTANRIMEIAGTHLIDKISSYDEYLDSDEMARKRQISQFDSEEDED
jgi:ATPase subunit of ABC transporter with duplicated ATPase domains